MNRQHPTDFEVLPVHFTDIGLHDLRHESAHLLGSVILRLPGGVGIGAEGKSRIVVTEHTADCFHIDTVLQRHRCKCMSEVVEPNTRQSCLFQQYFNAAVRGARVCGLLRFQWIWEYPLSQGSPFPLTQ